MNTAENLRFHAAGHLACAHALAESGDVKSAKFILQIVKAFCDSPRVAAPPSIGEMIESAMEAPRASLGEILLLEQWFCDPFNTVIEKSGAVR